MHRSTSLFALLITLLAAALPAYLSAQPIVTGLPTDKSAFIGTANATVTFDVVAVSADNGTLSYQWGIVTGNGNFTTVTNSSTYSGVLTPNLTVNNTDLTLNNGGTGTKYKCEITEGNTTFTTFGAILNVYNAPTVVPTLTISGNGVTSNTVLANSTANIVLTIGNLNTTSNDTVSVQRYLDTNGDGKVEAGKPLVEKFAVTNNKVTAFGSVTDPVIPGDDTNINGTINTHINLSTSNEVGQISGNYIIKIGSPTGEFIPITQILTVTQPNYGPSVSGQVTSNGTGVPFAPVAMLQQTDSNGDETFIAGTVANATGNFTLNAPLGSNYALLGFAAGYVSPFSLAPSFDLTSNTNLSGKNIGVSPATCMITGKVLDSVTSNPISSVQFFAQGNSTQSIATSLSNNNGEFVIPVVADTWDIDFSDYSLPPLGYLRPQNKPSATTTAETDSENNGGNNNTANAGITNITVSLLAVNALIYGTVTNNGSPLANVLLDGSDSNNNQATATTNASGYYYMGVNGPTGGSGDNWNVSADSKNPTLNGLVPFSGNNFTVNNNTAQEANFTTQTVTAYINGTVIDLSNSTALGNLPIQAELNNNSGNFVQVQTTTDDSGNFSFGVFGGSWNIQLDYGSGNDTQNATLSNLVSESLNENVTNGTNITVTPYFAVLNATNTITGNVLDGNGAPVSNTNINAQTTNNTTIGGLSYTSYANTNSNGTYSLPVVNGTWNVFPGTQIYPTVMITVNGSSANPIIQNFAPSPFLVWVQNNFGSNQLGDPNTATETPVGDGIPNLVKYAFNLNPTTNQQQNLPQATLSGGALHLVFDKTASDITYTVQSSTDLVTWTTTDPSLLVEDCGEQVTATYTLTGHPIAFLRILITLNN